MTRRIFCKVLLIVFAIFGLFVLSGVLLAQGRSEDAFERVREVQERNTDRLLAMDGVEGTAIGYNQNERLAIKVFTAGPGVRGIPQELDGVPVQVVVTGKIYALSTTDKLPRPVPIGVSTGNVGECSAGTIGCRVKDTSGNVYALSNNHVYALENKASDNSIILQPGLYDTGCVYDPDNVIGTLAAFEQIVFSEDAENTIDAAIALLTNTDMVGTATPSDGYGTPSSTIVIVTDGLLPLPVQKYGRTTSLTKGTITGISANVKVGYSSGTAIFVNQIIVEARTPFIKAGDSGSLLVTDPDKNPVGLLFAGNASGKFAVANPIDLVLSAFGVTVDSEEPAPPTTGTIDGTVTDVDTALAIEGATVTADGYSTTTAANGTYTLADLPVGSYIVTASATGYTDESKTGDVLEGQTTTVNFALTPKTTTGTVSVKSITYATEGGRDGKKHLLITVALEDDLDNPVAGASVSIDLLLGGSAYTSGTGTTGTDGTITFKVANAPSGTYTTEVTNVTAAGLDWDGNTPPNEFTK